MSLKQVMALVQKLWPQLSLQLGQHLEKNLTTMIRQDAYLRDALPRALEERPSAVKLQQYFPQMAALFNQAYKTESDYGTKLRQGQIVAPRQTQEQSLSLTLRQNYQLTQKLSMKLELRQTNWSLVEAYVPEEDLGCKIPKGKISGIGRMSLEEKLKKVDEANEVFHFEYGKSDKKYFKVPLVRNMNIDPAETAVKITKKEHDYAVKVLGEAGNVQRIVRAVPYSEINRQIKSHLDEKEISLEDVVLVGVDRGGRLPTHIVKEALGKSEAYFLKVDQGSRNLDDDRFQDYIDKGLFEGKYVIFIDSTVDSGRQIRALEKYFDDEDLQEDIKHQGWVVVGSNEYGKTLDNHVNIDWGLDPDKSFEDNPRLMGVDYAGGYTKIRACGNKMSSHLRSALLEVPKGVILDTGAVQSKKRTRKKEVKEKAVQNSAKSKIPNLLIIGDGNNCTLDDQEATYIALKVENGYHVMAGTPNGNPGNVIEQISQFPENKGVTLLQPAYKKGKVDTNGYKVSYVGKDKDSFRDSMIKKADVVLALPGNDGTWTEIQKSLKQGKKTIVLSQGYTGNLARQLQDPNLTVSDKLEDAVNAVRSYRS